MKDTIAVDDKLGNVKRALEAEGYQIKGLTDGLQGVMAVVVSGLDDNFLGHQDIKTEAPVIDASGRDVADIVAIVNRYAKEIIQ